MVKFKSLFIILIAATLVCTSATLSAKDTKEKTEAQDHDGHNHDGHNHDDHDGHDHDDHNHGDEAHGDDHHTDHGPGVCVPVDAHHDFEVGDVAMHHISDANVFSIGHFNFPLPCFLYAPSKGWDVFSSGKFNFETYSNGNGRTAYNGYVLHAGTVKRIRDNGFPKGEVVITGFGHDKETVDGKTKDYDFVCANGNKYPLDKKSTADFGLFGGGITSYYDFSLTKNVVSMILMFLLMAFIFIRIAKAYKNREGKAPSGLQSFFEPVIVFIRDEVAVPFLGHKWEKFFPYLLSIFFFILSLNLFGQIPFFGNANVTGNLAVTAVLAIVTFIITTINGNAHYWSHIFAAPGVPWFVKPILIPVEILGMFIKPLTLMLRLFANITAGHIVMVVFVGLIFIFGKSGESLPGTFGAAIGSTLLTIFMMAIELIVALVQAFVFTILTASYIGAATEEVHH